MGIFFVCVFLGLESSVVFFKIVYNFLDVNKLLKCVRMRGMKDNYFSRGELF